MYDVMFILSSPALVGCESDAGRHDFVLYDLAIMIYVRNFECPCTALTVFE